MLHSLFLFTSSMFATPTAQTSRQLELHWGSKVYDVRELSADTSFDLLLRIAERSRVVTANFNTPSTWENFPVSQRAELSNALQLLPVLITRFEYGRVGSVDPLAQLGPFLNDLYWGGLIVTANEREHDALWRASLSTLVDRNRMWELQAKLKDYNPAYVWTWNYETLDLMNPDRPVAVGAAMLLAERNVQPAIMPGNDLSSAATSFRGASEWSLVAFDATADPFEKARIANQAAALALAYGGRAKDVLIPTAVVLGPEGPFGRTTTAYESAVWWAERALDTWLSIPEEQRSEESWWDHNVRSGFALAVLQRERLRMELIDIGMINDSALVKPTGDDLALARRAFDQDTWYKWSLYGLSLELDIELSPSTINIGDVRKELHQLVAMADGGASLKRSVCDDIVNRHRIYKFDTPSGSLQPELRNLARIYKCEMSAAANAALGLNLP